MNNYSSIILAVLSFIAASGQNMTITGQIIDSENGDVLPFANLW